MKWHSFTPWIIIVCEFHHCYNLKMYLIEDCLFICILANSVSVGVAEGFQNKLWMCWHALC